MGETDKIIYWWWHIISWAFSWQYSFLPLPLMVVILSTCKTQSFSICFSKQICKLLFKLLLTSDPHAMNLKYHLMHLFVFTYNPNCCSCITFRIAISYEQVIWYLQNKGARNQTWSCPISFISICKTPYQIHRDNLWRDREKWVIHWEVWLTLTIINSFIYYLT